MKGYLYKCVGCGRMRIVPEGKGWLQNYRYCSECGARTEPKGPVEYGIDYNELQESVTPLQPITGELKIAEGIAADGFLHLREGDVLILQTRMRMPDESIKKKQDEIFKRTGIKTEIIGESHNVIGAVERDAMQC